MDNANQEQGNGGFLAIGAVVLGFILFSMRKKPKGDGGGGDDDPVEGGGGDGDVLLAGNITNVAVEQLASMGQVQKFRNDVVTISFVVFNRVTLNGIQVPWNFKFIVGIGDPEAPFPGRQFKTDPTMTRKTGEIRLGPGEERPVTIQLSISPLIQPGIKDVMVSVVARRTERSDGGNDVDTVWPFEPSLTWGEVAAQLVQDAVEIIEPRFQISGAINSVTVAQDPVMSSHTSVEDTLFDGE